jgi:hypothetical protein
MPLMVIAVGLEHVSHHPVRANWAKRKGTHWSSAIWTCAFSPVERAMGFEEEGQARLAFFIVSLT